MHIENTASFPEARPGQPTNTKMKRHFLQLPHILRRQPGSMRHLGGFGTDSILGTSMLSGNLLKTVQEDLRREQNIRKHGIGETLTNFIRKDELSHMESADADEVFQAKLKSRVDDFFATIPLPEDPMKAALAKSQEELEDEAAIEVVREAVREAYMRKLSAKQAEELRLKRAMHKVEKGREEYDAFRDERNGDERAATAAAAASRGVSKSATQRPAHDEIVDENEALRQELEAMKQRMAELEKALSGKN